MICYHCNSGINDYNTNYNICPACKIIYNKKYEYDEKLYLNLEQYSNEKLRLNLYSDKPHYDRFMEKYLNVFDEYDEILSFGGGFPKMESYINSKIIQVFDLIPHQYIVNLATFKSIFKPKSDILYLQNNILELNRTNIIQNNKIKYLSSFCHILEHLKYEDIVKLLKETTTDINIYQPCPDTIQNKDNWFHFGIDHLTFLPINIMNDLLKQFKFEIKISAIFDNDMFIYAKKS